MAANLSRITRFEKARVIGQRATQLANGALPKTEIGNLHDPILIAEKEYLEGTIPICIVRPLPNGKKVLITIVPKVNQLH